MVIGLIKARKELKAIRAIGVNFSDLLIETSGIYSNYLPIFLI